MNSHQIGARIKVLREERKLSQDSLARLFGFKDRQTVSAIETGVRRVAAEELVTRGREARRTAGIFHRPFSARWRRELFMAAIGRRCTATRSVRTQRRTLDRRVPGPSPASRARSSAFASRAGSDAPFAVRGR